jgi:cell wall-associated NlpC family hydrolase
MRRLLALVATLGCCLASAPLAQADSPSNSGAPTPPRGDPGGASSQEPFSQLPRVSPPLFDGPITRGPGARVVGGVARAPRGAPRAVRRLIRAANRLRHKPYRYGGGHQSFGDSAYDCSGAVSYALHGAGLLPAPLDSVGLAAWGASGPGRWITVYANRRHAFLVVAGLRLDTSGAGESGPRWRLEPRSTAGFTRRHPVGI